MPQPYTIVIPCYNEAERFPLQAFNAFTSSRPNIRFLLVNDGSKDHTLAVLHSAAAAHPDRVEVLDMPQNSGKAGAVRAGMLQAMQRSDCRFAGYWDADMATPLDAIEEFAAVLEERPQTVMVFGARVKLLGRAIERRATRHYLGRVFATVVSQVLGLAIYDTQCGAKLFRVLPETRELFTDPFCSRWVFDVEILARFIRHHRFNRAAVEMAIFEFPLRQWCDVAGSRLRPRDFLRAFFDVVKIRRSYFQNR